MKLFILGSTGDLVKRKVLPALQELGDKSLEIYALGRKDYTDELYHDFVCGDFCTIWFKKQLKYLQIDFDNEYLLGKCHDLLSRNEINYFYVSLPPHVLDKIFHSLGKYK